MFYWLENAKWPNPKYERLHNNVDTGKQDLLVTVSRKILSKIHIQSISLFMDPTFANLPIC